MTFELSPLPYPTDALAPWISTDTLRTHHGKHHKAYVDKLNELVRTTRFAELPLEEVVRQTRGPLFENAAQVWNHDFYWRSMRPGGGDDPVGELSARIAQSFGSLDEFRSEFTEAATHLFGSGYVWLVLQAGDQLGIKAMHNADNPLKTADIALLCVDVWEHAYYLDRKNERARYIEAFWKLVDWNFAAQNLAAARPTGAARF